MKIQGTNHTVKELSKNEIAAAMRLTGFIAPEDAITYAGAIIDAAGNTQEGALWEASAIISFGVVA